MKVKVSTISLVGLFVFIFIMAAMVSVAMMQVIIAEVEIGSGVYVLGGAIFAVCSLVPIMLIILIRCWVKYLIESETKNESKER